MRAKSSKQRCPALCLLKHKTTLTEQNRSTKLLMIDQIQIVKDLTATDQVPVAPYTLLRSSNSDCQIMWLHKPTTDTQTRQNCLRN